ncbi:MAG: dienelactone hydrolase family protein [Rubrobacter sp.]|jgi:dienelactone hydrolase|nr:dienelactone hydrolase family protein [Rubrobacter sp.]MDQ3377135.1 dienelactone hydrolase family protein [Actinomycetota bacterium]
MREARVVRRPVEEKGLVGTLFHPSAPAPHPAVIALGGAGGGLSEGGAKTLASEGFAALALAYFGIDPLPEDLVEIPLEYFERAIAWLKAQPAVDADRVAVVGNSKGGELALLLGATYPEDVKAVVGYAPSGVVWQGLPLDREVYHGGHRSPWSLRGEPLPFVGLLGPSASETVEMTKSFFAGRPLSTRSLYERALDDESAVAAASIAVEKIDAPVLLVSGADDRLWPSTRLSEMAIKRLEVPDRPFPSEHLRYEGAGHLIALPGYEPARSWTNRFELGGSREANEFANADSWTKVLGFLEEHLKSGAG